jgi:hypothetical protein
MRDAQILTTKDKLTDTNKNFMLLLNPYMAKTLIDKNEVMSKA